MKIKIPKDKMVNDKKYRDMLLPDITEFEPDYGEYTWKDIKAMHKDGLTIEGFRGVIKMSESYLKYSIPAGFPNRESPEGDAYKWSEYHDKYHHPVIYDGTAFISANTYGKDFTMEMLLLADEKNYITVLSNKEFTDVRSSWR